MRTLREAALRRAWSRGWLLLGVSAVMAGGCGSGMDGPTPTIEGKPRAVDPAILCADQLTTDVTVRGKGFSPVPIDVPDHPRIAIPDLTLVRTTALDGSVASEASVLFSGDPEKDTNVALLSWKSQEEMHLTVNQAIDVGGAAQALEAGVYDLRVRNPNDKTGHKVGALAVARRPELSTVTPGLVCLAQGARTLEFAGTTFLDIESTLPRVTFEGGSAPVAVSKLDGCKDVATDAVKARACTKASLSLAEDALAVGLHALTLTNPETAACHSEEKLELRVVAPPSISAVTPPVACTLDGNHALVIEGSDFLRVDGQSPAVTLGGMSVPVKDLVGCTDLPTSGHQVEACTGIQLDIDASAFPVGDVAVTVTNPEPAGCAATGSAVFRIAGLPMISSVAPSEICNGVASDLTIRGTGFDPAAQVLVGSTAATVTFVTAEELTATVPMGIAPGKYDVTVTNVGSCTDTSAASLTIDASPIVFFVDPPVAYAQIPIEVTIFTSGLSSEASLVELVHEDGTTRQTLTDFDSPTNPNKILAQVPAGLKPGKWDVLVTDKGGCPGALLSGFTVTDTLNDALVTEIKPSFASPSQATAVTILGAGFTPVPRVYLTPSAATGTARALSAVQVKQGGAAMTALVPAGLTPGSYDLIVVNPSGEVDVLAAGLTVTADEPPVVSSVTPASLPSNATGKSITIAGTGFKPGLTVELDCVTSTGASTVVPTVAGAPSGDGKTVAVSVTMASGAPSAPDPGSVCLVRLANADGAFFEYSAFSVTNSSLNLFSWQSSTDMTTPRRALSLVAGRPTNTSRYLYAIGGDDGVANAPASRGPTVFKSIDSTNVDVFGGLETWTLQRNELPAPRTGAGAVTIGRFVYLVGGHDGSSAQNTLLRAQILDPLDGPEIVDLDATLGDGVSGLGGGLYYYRVAAVYASTDADNPGGESLAGELLPVQLPDRADKIVLTLSWSEVQGAHGYRLYRSPTPGADAGALELVGEVSCGATPSDTCNCGSDPTRCELIDNGAATSAGKTPLPAGSLGVWHTVDGARCSTANCTLGSPREGLATAAIADPGAPGTWYLYAFGGRDAGANYLDSYEVAVISVSSDGSQTVADFVAGSDTLAVPRADFGAWVMSKTNSNVIASSATPNDVWVYLGGGRTTGDATNQTLEAGKLGTGGDLGTFASTDSLKGAIVGFGVGAANDQLYTFGGIAGTADGTSASLCDGSGACAALPDLKSGAFNALGAATTQRMFTSATQESAFFFLAGGHDGASTLSTSEQTVQ